MTLQPNGLAGSPPGFGGQSTLSCGAGAHTSSCRSLLYEGSWFFYFLASLQEL